MCSAILAKAEGSGGLFGAPPDEDSKTYNDDCGTDQQREHGMTSRETKILASAAMNRSWRRPVPTAGEPANRRTAPTSPRDPAKYIRLACHGPTRRDGRQQITQKSAS